MNDVPLPCARWLAKSVALAFTLAAFALTATMAPARADQHDDDAALGQKVYDDLKAKYQIVEESRYLPVLRRVGDKVARAGGPQWYTERFYVVRGNGINAFSAPGGYVFVNEGLLRTLNNVDELANVLGHETAHLVLGHVEAKIGQEKRKNLLLNVGKVFVKQGSQTSQNTFDTVTKMGNYTFLNFTRQQEYGADELGAKLAAQAGYNPWGTVWFFDQLARLVGDSGYEQYVQQHPSTEDRIARISGYLHDHAAEYARWANRQPSTTSLPAS
jgi:beta-barrel assembly-enhancing protease